jgi:hypothetical protein
MPLLKINQSARSVLLSGLVSLLPSRSISTPLSSTPTDGGVAKALDCVFSKDRDFQDFLKTPQAKQVPSTLHVRTVRAMVRRMSRQRSL